MFRCWLFLPIFLLGIGAATGEKNVPKIGKIILCAKIRLAVE